VIGSLDWDVAVLYRVVKDLAIRIIDTRAENLEELGGNHEVSARKAFQIEGQR
jgi:hypothetical protein